MCCNVTCGKRHNLVELVEALNHILDTSLTPIHTAPHPGAVRHSQADISRAKRVLSYRVEVEFEEGLERAVEWYKSRR